jgi:CRP-like cAMP-binding protein
MTSQIKKKLYINYFGARLRRLGLLSDEAWNAFASCMSYLKLKKGEILTKRGDVEDYVYYIVKGSVRIYCQLKDKEISTNFRFEDQFTSSISSFLTRQKSQYTICTMAPSEFLRFNHTQLYSLYDNFVELNALGRVLIENLLVEKRQRELDFLTLTADERYVKLLNEQPKYALELPMKHVASFLGITPQSLSRIRADLMNSS